MYANRPTKILKRLVPPPRPIQSQKASKAPSRHSKLVKDSADMSAIDEGILVNKPRVSQKCQFSMFDKNRAVSPSFSNIRLNLSKKPSFEVRKVIKQVHTKNIEWIDIERLYTSPEEVSELELEAKMIIKRFECKATCESSEDSSINSSDTEVRLDADHKGLMLGSVAICETQENEYTKMHTRLKASEPTEKGKGSRNLKTEANFDH